MLERSLSYIRLDVIEPAEINAKNHDLPHIVASIQEHGFAGALLVDERTRKLIAGHGRLEALQYMKKKGKRCPDGITKDTDGEWMVPVLRGWTSKDNVDAMALNVRDNKLTIDGGWDNRRLVTMLEEIATADAELFDAMGFTSDDLDELLRQIDPETLNPDPEEGSIGGGEQDEPSRICCPACGYLWNSKL